MLSCPCLQAFHHQTLGLDSARRVIKRKSDMEHGTDLELPRSLEAHPAFADFAGRVLSIHGIRAVVQKNGRSDAMMRCRHERKKWRRLGWHFTHTGLA